MMCTLYDDLPCCNPPQITCRNKACNIMKWRDEIANDPIALRLWLKDINDKELMAVARRWNKCTHIDSQVVDTCKAIAIEFMNRIDDQDDPVAFCKALYTHNTM